MKLPYNPDNKDSIIEFAKLLIGKSVQTEFGNDIPKLNLSNNDKGQLGKVIEELYFRYKNNSNSAADFKKAGLELKSSGLKQLKNKEFRAKERLVLNIINYVKIINQKFEDDFLIGKNAHLLLVFYLYQKNINQLTSIIKLVGDWKYPDEDLEIIRKDWELIRKKIADGNAHELSEGDTFYLGASTKGGKGGNFRLQPNSDIQAKQRAYSLKHGYVNHIIASIAKEPLGVYGKLITSVDIARKQTIEEIVFARFNPFLGKTDKELVNLFSLQYIKTTAKNYYSIISNSITKSILNVPRNKNIEEYVEEFSKAGIEVKTIRVEIDNSIEQSVSFPAFEFEKIYNENWITSDLKELIEKKFLFIFFKNDGRSYYLEKVKFWNMPFNDRNEVRKVWLKTKFLIQNGNIFRDYSYDKNGNKKYTKKGNPIRFNHLPKSSESTVCHVRPHGNDSTHTFPLPVKDKTLKVNEYSKQCFWLNSTYVRDQIYP